MPALSSSKRTKAASRSTCSTKTVLVLEDEVFVREVTCEILRNAGYRVLEASTVAEAEELLGQAARAPDLLVCDVVLPDGSGFAVANAARQRFPALKTIFASGYPPATLRRELDIQCTGRPTLTKPYCGSSLISRVHEALA